MQKITILWWTSWFWLWLAKYIRSNFKEFVEITITWIDSEKGLILAKENWFSFNVNNIEAVKNADITIVSVPISKTYDVIKQIWPYIRAWSYLADVTSVKVMPYEAMKKFVPQAKIIATHPMFWPYVTTIAWQVCVLCSDEIIKEDSGYTFLLSYLKNAGAKLIETKAAAHDNIMAVVQGLTHFFLFTFGHTMRNLNIDLSFAQNFVSPIYKILTSSVGRYLYQDPGLYADIQMYNPAVLTVHNELMKSGLDIHHEVAQQNRQWFIDHITATKDFFGDLCKEWQQYTDKIIFLIWDQTAIAHDSLWKRLQFRNIYNKEVIEDVLVEFKDGLLYTKDSGVLEMDIYVISAL